VGGDVGGPGKALQGNIDPNVLFAPPEADPHGSGARARQLRLPHTDRDTTGPTQIFNLGHGISQYTPPEHVAVRWWKRCMPTRARSAPEGSVRRLGRGSGPGPTRASRAQNRCRQAFSAGFPEK
jgi:hypothetical protein